MLRFNEPDGESRVGLHCGETVRSRSIDLLLASLPLLLWSIRMNGLRTLTVALLSVVCAMGFEAAYEWLVRRRFTLDDLTACTDGVLFALLMPVTVPLWMIPLGVLFGQVVCKCLPGGPGRQIVSPSIGGAALLTLLFRTRMVTFAVNRSFPAVLSAAPKGDVEGSLLMRMWDTPLPSGVTSADLLLGRLPNVIGALSAVLVLLGFIYLLIRKTARAELVLFSLLPIALTALLFPAPTLASDALILRYSLFQICSGSLLLVSVYHASETACAPDTTRGRALFGLGIGLITLLFRQLTIFEEGAVIALCAMQALWSVIGLLRVRRKASAD